MAEHTPMIKQYLEIKAQYEDAFLFFRLGDFYELFFDDAKKASQELEITLTGRGADKEKIPMCGVPYHAADNYISQLIDKGYKIAICEQVEDPKTAKGVVKREVVKLITPGTMMEGKMIQEKENSFIASVSPFDDGTYGIARSDLTTGENFVTVLENDDEVLSELAIVGAKEVVFPREFPEELQNKVKKMLHVTVSYEEDDALKGDYRPLCENIGQVKLERSFARLCNYLDRTQKRSLTHLQPVEFYTTKQSMKIDVHSKRNLELTETIRDKKKKGSLLWLLDDTVTAMGGRMMKRWIDRPLLDEVEIQKRLSMVEALYEQFFVREELRDLLKGVYDLERLAGKVAYGNVNARDLVQLRHSLGQVPLIVQVVNRLANPNIQKLVTEIDMPTELIELLEKSLVDEPPLSVKEGGMIRDGFHQELDSYRDANRNGKMWIAELEQREREETGVKSLKVGFNKIFGYYIEVTRSNLIHLPEGRYERKQTLANAERFVTPELKEKEVLILEAKEKIEELEYKLFQDIREQVKGFIHFLQSTAKKISTLDVLQSFATVSERQHFTKPRFSSDRLVQVMDGRHPVVERVLDRGEYVPNDIRMGEGREILLITGPNMAGKSTYMRQLALISVMAQIGCYVPASEAVLPIFDQIFTRIGAADDLASGQSTFMVEMLETKEALTKATHNSLVLLDEIGRGTSTYDGMALAQAIVEYIHGEIGAKTLFSTHYHELTALETELKHVQNIHVSAVEEDGKVVFLHKVIDGQADKSYGIYVAELAEMPKQVIARAEVILKQLEEGAGTAKIKEEEQLSLFVAEEPEPPPKDKRIRKAEQEILEDIRSVDVLHLTPFDALQKLNELQRQLRTK